jgi:hypothetical protein
MVTGSIEYILVEFFFGNEMNITWHLHNPVKRKELIVSMVNNDVSL